MNIVQKTFGNQTANQAKRLGLCYLTGRRQIFVAALARARKRRDLHRLATVATLGRRFTKNLVQIIAVQLGLAFVLLVCTSVLSAQEDGPTDGVLRIDKAWDYRPYRVRVWICTDGSPELNANFASLVKGLERRSILADPSAWELLVSRAPNPWGYRLPVLLESVIESDVIAGLAELPELKYDD